MQHIFLIPLVESIEPVDLLEIASRNKITVGTVKTLRDYIDLCSRSDISNSAILMIAEAPLLVMARNADQFFDELPTVLTAVPDVPYLSIWSTTATVFPGMSFDEFKGKFRKSGHSQQSSGGMARYNSQHRIPDDTNLPSGLEEREEDADFEAPGLA